MKSILSFLLDLVTVIIAVLLEDKFNVLSLVGMDGKSFSPAICIAFYTSILNRIYHVFASYYHENLESEIKCCFYYPKQYRDFNATPTFELANKNNICTSRIGIHIDIKGNAKILNTKLFIPGNKLLTVQLSQKSSKTNNVKIQTFVKISPVDNSLEVDFSKIIDIGASSFTGSIDFLVDVIGIPEAISQSRTERAKLKFEGKLSIIQRLLISFKSNCYVVKW